MSWKSVVAALLCSVTICAPAQDNAAAFRVTTRSALIWDRDSPANEDSSTVRDPRTGYEIHKLSHEGIEVSSRVGFEKVSPISAQKLLNYTTTVANNTDSDLEIHYGGVIVEGQAALPLWIAPTSKGFSKHDRKNIWELSKMQCFKTGFASGDNYFTAAELSNIFTVHPKTALTVSFVTIDPRTSSVLCSVDGCHIKGTVRYFMTVNRRDYVFVWPGSSIVYCGQ